MIIQPATCKRNNQWFVKNETVDAETYNKSEELERPVSQTSANALSSVGSGATTEKLSFLSSKSASVWRNSFAFLAR